MEAMKSNIGIKFCKTLSNCSKCFPCTMYSLVVRNRRLKSVLSFVMLHLKVGLFLVQLFVSSIKCVQFFQMTLITKIPVFWYFDLPPFWTGWSFLQTKLLAATYQEKSTLQYLWASKRNIHSILHGPSPDDETNLHLTP